MIIAYLARIVLVRLHRRKLPAMYLTGSTSLRSSFSRSQAALTLSAAIVESTAETTAMTTAIAAVPISNFVFKRTGVSASKADTPVFLQKNDLFKSIK